MRIPDAVVREIADKTDMLDVVGRYARLEKKGGRYWALCPFHQEKTPSFSVSPEKQLYYCFGCQAKGTLFTFVQQMEKLTFVEAVRLLGERAGVAIPSTDVSPEEDQKRAAVRELYGRAAGSLCHILWNNERGTKVRDYLAGRGVQVETAKRFGLGYAPVERHWLYRFLVQRSYTHEFLATTGLFLARPDQDGSLTAFFRDRLVFPIRSIRGDVVGFGGRAFDPSAPKYLNTPETPYFHKGEHLYGLDLAADAIKKEGAFLLAEGYMDVIALHQAGLANAIAPLGTALTERQAQVLGRYARHGVLCFDSDEAGRRATVRAAEILEAVGLECRVMKLDVKDPADLVERGEAAGLKTAYEAAQGAFQHLMEQALAREPQRTPEAKERVVAALAGYLGKVGSPVRRQGYISLLAETLDVGVDSVIEELDRGTRPGRGKPSTTPQGNPVVKARPRSDELRVLLAVAANRAYYADVRNSVNLDDLTDDSARTLYVALEECYRNNETTMDAFLRRLGDEHLEALVVSAAESGEFDLNAGGVIGDGIRTLRIKGLRRRARAIDTRLRSLGDTQSAELVGLLEEKMYVDRQLQEMKVAGDA